MTNMSTEGSPHELINRELPALPDMASVSPVVADELDAYVDASDSLVADLRAMVIHLERRVIEARIALHAALEVGPEESSFSKAWEAHELDPYAEKLFFTHAEDNLEPARQWILADNT